MINELDLYSETHLLEMPIEYKEISNEEEEYDGGLWFAITGIAAAVCTATSWACTAAAKVFPQYSKNLNKISVATGVAGTALGVVSGVGLLTSSANITTRAAAVAVHDMTLGAGHTIGSTIAYAAGK